MQEQILKQHITELLENCRDVELLYIIRGILFKEVVV